MAMMAMADGVFCIVKIAQKQRSIDIGGILVLLPFFVCLDSEFLNYWFTGDWRRLEETGELDFIAKRKTHPLHIQYTDLSSVLYQTLAVACFGFGN
jgi:hypothetical protein